MTFSLYRRQGSYPRWARQIVGTGEQDQVSGCTAHARRQPEPALMRFMPDRPLADRIRQLPAARVDSAQRPVFARHPSERGSSAPLADAAFRSGPQPHSTTVALVRGPRREPGRDQGRKGVADELHCLRSHWCWHLRQRLTGSGHGRLLPASEGVASEVVRRWV